MSIRCISAFVHLYHTFAHNTYESVKSLRVGCLKHVQTLITGD